MEKLNFVIFWWFLENNCGAWIWCDRVLELFSEVYRVTIQLLLPFTNCKQSLAVRTEVIENVLEYFSCT